MICGLLSCSQAMRRGCGGSWRSVGSLSPLTVPRKEVMIIPLLSVGFLPAHRPGEGDFGDPSFSVRPLALLWREGGSCGGPSYVAVSSLVIVSGKGGRRVHTSSVWSLPLHMLGNGDEAPSPVPGVLREKA